MRNVEASSRAAPAATEPSILARRSMRIGLGSVDAAGLIYFAAPLPWAEALFTDWLAGNGRPLGSVFAAGCAFPVVETRTRYRAPLRLDDVVELELAAVAVGGRSFTLRTRIAQPAAAEDEGVARPLAVEVEIVHVFVSGIDGDLRPTALPAWLRALLTGARDGA